MSRKEIFVNVDFFDELTLHGESMGPEDVRELVRQCKEAGVDALNWRAAGLGVAGYHSKLLTSLEWLATADRSALIDRSPDKTPLLNQRFSPDTPLDATLRRMDPMAEARDACREAGLGFHIWLDVFDEQNGRFLIENPECQVTGRDGITRWPGLRSYANEKAVEWMLAVVRELMEYEPDGFYFATSCHSRHLEFPEPDDFFGFEPEIAAAFERETGRNLLTIADAADYDIWHRIKGDFFTEFLRRAKATLKPGMQLAVGTQFGPQTQFTCPVFSEDVKYRFETQWQRWIDEGIADALVLGDYEWTWDWGVPPWRPKGFEPPPGKQLSDILAPEYVTYADGRVKLRFFSSWLEAYAKQHQGASAANLADAMRMRSRTILETGVDGICLHEAHTFEFYDGFETIVEMRRTLDEGSAI